MKSWYSPDASPKYAMDFPSGDQAGSRSAEPGVRVRLRVSPFSAGMVKMSPCASTKRRTPVGDIAVFFTSLGGAAARRRYCGVLHFSRRHAGQMRRQMRQVAVNRDGHGVFLMRRQVIEVE